MRVGIKSLAIGLAIALLGSSPTSAQSLSTTYAGGNSGTTLWTNQFDITILNSAGLTITDFDVNCENSRSGPIGTTFTLNVFVTALGGTYIGNQSNPAVWTQVSTGTGISLAQGTPTPVDVADFSLQPGTYGMALQYISTAMAYTNGNGTNQHYQNSDLMLDLGSSSTGLFGTPIYDPRVWNGTIYYVPACAGRITTAGTGCADSGGTVNTIHSRGCPDIGTTLGIDIHASATATGPAIVVMGLSDTFWQSIQLPLPLDPFGAVGCSVYTSHDIFLGPLSFTSGVAGIDLPIPNNPAFIGATSYHQGYHVDPLANNLSLVLTDYLTVVSG